MNLSRVNIYLNISQAECKYLDICLERINNMVLSTSFSYIADSALYRYASRFLFFCNIILEVFIIYNYISPAAGKRGQMFALRLHR